MKAGVLLAGDGLHPSSKGARVLFSGDKRTVVDGPFAETKELVAGFWLWQVGSKDEAIEWVKRCPNPTGGESIIEIRQVFEPEDFGEEFTPEARAGRGPHPRAAGLQGVAVALEPGDAYRAIDAIWRIESARLIAGLVRMVRDVGLAEDLAQDALVAALEQWPRDGVPDNPGAWLMATAKRRAIDRLRRGAALERKYAELGHELEQEQRTADPGLEAVIEDDEVGDDLLRLVFMTCHPVLSTEAQVALTLRLLGGLTTAEIARAFLVPEPTVAQRIVRAKRTLAEARVPFEVPAGAGAARAAGRGARGRVPGVQRGLLGHRRGGLDAAGAVRGGAAPGADPGRAGPARARGARPGGAHGDPGLALRRPRRPRRTSRSCCSTRTAPAGTGCSSPAASPPCARAEGLGAPLGPYALQAAIAACHARALTPEATDWERIAALYDALAQITPSPVVELNRAVAVGMAFGPAEGLALADALADEPALAAYHLLPAVRGDLLAKLGRSGRGARRVRARGRADAQRARARPAARARGRRGLSATGWGVSRP